MSHMRSSTLPSITEAFGGNYRLMAALNQAGFKSVVPLMMLPREALLEIPGIGISSAVLVTKTLKKYGYGQHNICERMSTFIEEQFGSIEDAPISTLQVTVVREDIVNRPVFAPLEIISLLEDIESHFTIRDLIRMSRDEVRSLVQSQAAFGMQIHDLPEDIKHLAIRLGNFDLEFVRSPSRELQAVT